MARRRQIRLVCQLRAASADDYLPQASKRSAPMRYFSFALRFLLSEIPGRIAILRMGVRRSLHKLCDLQPPLRNKHRVRVSPIWESQNESKAAAVGKTKHSVFCFAALKLASPLIRLDQNDGRLRCRRRRTKPAGSGYFRRFPGRRDPRRRGRRGSGRTADSCRACHRTRGRRWNRS